MQEAVPWYGRALDLEALWREFPPPPDYGARTHRLSRDELRQIQERRFLEQIARGWQVPFYRLHWSEAGMEPRRHSIARRPGEDPALHRA